MNKFAQLSNNELQTLKNVYVMAYYCYSHELKIDRNTPDLDDEQLLYLDLIDEMQKRLETSGLCNLASQVFKSEQ